MGIAVEKLGIFDDLQTKGERYLPAPRLVHAEDFVNRKSAIEEAARIAVDEAIADAVRREVQRRMIEIEELVMSDGPSIASIIAAVSAATGMTLDELRTNTRVRAAARARWLFWYIASALRRDLSLPALAKVVGCSDHTTVMHGLKQFPLLRQAEPLRSYCTHPSTATFLVEADKRPRR